MLDASFNLVKSMSDSTLLKGFGRAEMAPSTQRVGHFEKQGENGKPEEACPASDRLGSPIPPLRVRLSGAYKKAFFHYFALDFWHAFTIAFLL